MSLSTLIPSLALVCTLQLLAAVAQAQDAIGVQDWTPGMVVTVELADGRLATGTIDELTDDQRVWLRSETDRVSLRSGFSWRDVVGIEQGSPQGVMRIESFDDHIVPPPMPVGEQIPADLRPPTLLPTEQFQANTSLGEVRTLRINAAVMNWDKDVEADGLQVLIQPLNANWQVVPASGNISFELKAELDPLTSSRGRSPERRIQSLERWTVRLTTADFQSSGAIVEIPFRRFRPEVDLEIAPIGRLEARFSLAGQGSFEAECYTVLRPPLPITVGEHPHDWENDSSEPVTRLVRPIFGVTDW